MIGAKEISDFNRENINVRQLPPLLVLIGAKEISGFTEKTGSCLTLMFSL